MENYFAVLNSIDCSGKTEKKNGLTYLSWAWAWGELKKKFPDAAYTIYENSNGLFYHTDGRTCWVKTGVTVNGIEYIDYLPVMDFKNNSIPLEKVTSFDVNKAIQRSLTKAVARHGLGLYIYAGEDLPEDAEKSIEKPAEKPKKAKEDFPILDNTEIPGVPTCEKCGLPFTEFQDPKTGVKYSPADVAQLAFERRGAKVCKKCFAMGKL